MAKAGKKALLKVVGAGISMTAEPTTALVALTTYQITNAAKQILDPFLAITVKTATDGITYTTTGVAYTVNRLTGTITFPSAQPASTTVQITGTYLPTAIAAEAKGYTYSILAQNLDTSVFGAVNVSRIQGLKDCNGSVTSLYQTDTYFRDSLINDTLAIIEFWSDSATSYDVRVWAKLNKRAIAAAVNGLVEQTVDFEGAGDADKRVVSG
jgi:hypothetical protein